MTISSTVNRNSTAGDGIVTAFSFPYLFFADDDLTVILVIDSTGVETVQTITTHYTVTGAGVAAGGTVTMVTPPASGETLVIIRKEQFTQGLDLVENDPFPSDLVEQQLDTLTMLSQQLNTEQQRSIKLSDGDTSGVDLTLPTPVALKTIRWNAGATALEETDDPGVSATAAAASAAAALVSEGLADADATAAAASAAAASTSETNAATSETNAAASAASIPTISAFMLTVVDDATAADARTTLGVLGSAGGTMTGDITMSGASIFDAHASIAAHATTMDPWSLGNYVTLTGGAVTFTALANAPQAGAEVELYINAAHVFTDGAVFEVDGNANYTAAVGDRVLIRAKSTTVFTVHPRKADGTAVVAGAADTFSSELIHIQDQKSDGTQGGTLTTGSWQTRVLNTVLTNEITGASLATNQITLPAGTYYTESEGLTYGTQGGVRHKLYDTTGTADLLLSLSGNQESNHNEIGEVRGRFTLSTGSVIEFQARNGTTVATNGLGSHDSLTVGVEIYADVKIWKVG